MTTKLECDALLFDLDGVLIDSSRCITRHWGNWARRHNLALDDIMRVAHGVRTIETMRMIAPHLDVEAEAAQFTAREVVDTEGVEAIEGAAPLLGALPAGAWAIVTSAERALAAARLKHAGLSIPETLVSGDDVHQGKPSPEPYLTGASRLGVPAARCIVIEDAPAGIASARAAGMRVIGIASTHAREELDCTVVVGRLTALRVQVQDGSGSRLMIQTEERGGNLHGAGD